MRSGPSAMHEDELIALRAEIKTMSIPNPKPISQPIIPPAQQPVQQPVQQPDSQPITQPTMQPDLLLTSPPMLTSSPILCPATGKKRNKKKNIQDNTKLDIQSLASALFCLNEEKHLRDFLGYVPRRTPSQFYQPPKTLPLSNFSPPRCARIAPGIHPGIIPLMNIVFY